MVRRPPEIGREPVAKRTERAREIGRDAHHVRLLGRTDVVRGALDQHDEPQAEQRERDHDLEQRESALATHC